MAALAALEWPKLITSPAAAAAAVGAKTLASPAMVEMVAALAALVDQATPQAALAVMLMAAAEVLAGQAPFPAAAALAAAETMKPVTPAAMEPLVESRFTDPFPRRRR